MHHEGDKTVLCDVICTMIMREGIIYHEGDDGILWYRILIAILRNRYYA